MSSAPASVPKAGLDIEALRRDFPNLARKVHGKPLIYFDNAASAQRPQAMIDAVNQYYTVHNANVHRGVHSLSEEATAQYEGSRDAMTEFIGASDRREIIFVRGATEGINLVAQAFLRPLIKPGEQILISHMEHHSNIVPWQMVCEQTGAELKVIPMNQRGELIWEEFERLLSPRVKMLACGHVSNALGTVNPIQRMARNAREMGIPMLVDGAQAAPHLPLDVADLGVDFYCVSGHKMFAPTGIGVLYGRRERLEAMAPYQGGGEMIRHVSFEETTYNELPSKFEAGTPNIAGAIGLGATARYLQEIGMSAIQARELELLAYASDAIGSVEGVTLVGTAAEKAGVISFTLEGVHPHDLGTILDHHGVAIRTGHHCAMPVMQFFGLPATSRASLAFYNTRQEVDRFVEALTKAQKMLL
jgi:cysteine desulfurase/selenocysteine lyase